MNIVNIPPEWGVKRIPRTPIDPDKEWHCMSYEDLYDWDSLFYEAINIGDQRVLLVGAPLYELEREISFSYNGKKLNHSYHHFDRCIVTMVEGVTSNQIQLDHSKKNITVDISDASPKFSGMHVITTKQKDEPLEWIEEWVQYYYRAYGVRGFVFYNNNCTKYTADEMKEYLQKVSSEIIIEVIDVNVPFGPPSPRWDSDYMQYVILEHFKYKFGWCAKSVINQDVDELLVIPPNMSYDGMITDLLEKGAPGLSYCTIFIDPYSPVTKVSSHTLPREDVHFKDYYLWWDNPERNPRTPTGRKWIVIPTNCVEYQWALHRVDNPRMISIPKFPMQIYYSHFLAFKSHTKDKSNNLKARNKNVSVANMNELKVDEHLKFRLEQAFPSN